MGAHANDWLGKTDENGQKRFRTENRAGMHGKWLSVAFRFPPLIPVPFRFFRQSRRDERTRQGLAGELGSLSVFCAGVCEEKLSVTFRFPPFVSVPFRSAPAETIHIIHAMLCRHGLSLIPCNKIKNHSHKQNEVRNISDADF